MNKTSLKRLNIIKPLLNSHTHIGLHFCVAYSKCVTTLWHARTYLSTRVERLSRGKHKCTHCGPTFYGQEFNPTQKRTQLIFSRCGPDASIIIFNNMCGPREALLYVLGVGELSILIPLSLLLECFRPGCSPETFLTTWR